MRIDQILLRPTEKLMVIRYGDSAGRQSNLAFENVEKASVASLIAECETLLPPEAEQPSKAEVEQEIEELEYRLNLLKQSIGQG